MIEEMGTYHQLLGKNGKVRIGNLVPTSIIYIPKTQNPSIIYIYAYIWLQLRNCRNANPAQTRLEDKEKTKIPSFVLKSYLGTL